VREESGTETSADAYFAVMITSPRRLLHRMHTTEKSTEKQLQLRVVYQRESSLYLTAKRADIDWSWKSLCRKSHDALGGIG